jgi:hypothetical protein
MKYCRVDLSKTNYQPLRYTQILSSVARDDRMEDLQEIYRKYCTYKKFESVMPLFAGMIFDKYTDVICYYPNDKLSAFSLVKRYDRENAEALQFAWDYNDPELRLGIESLKHECAYYKQQGYNYLYLGLANEYKKEIDGYETLGPI